MNLVLLLNVAVQDLDVQATQDMQVPIYSIKLILEIFVDLSVLKDLIFALPIRQLPYFVGYEKFPASIK